MRVESEDGDEPIDLTRTQTLVIQAKKGEDTAFTELYTRHASRVRHSVATRLGGYTTPDLEDVVQETFLYAFEVIRDGRFDATRSEGGFRHWLAKIAVNKARDGVRRNKTKARGAGKEKVMRDAFSSSSAELYLPSPLGRPSEVLAPAATIPRLTERWVVRNSTLSFVLPLAMP